VPDEHVRIRCGARQAAAQRNGEPPHMATPLETARRTSARRPATARRVVLALAAVLGAVFSTVPAQAAPATSAEAAQLVAAKGHELEVVTEEFNEAREALDAHRATAEAAAAELEAATAALAAAQQQVRGIARTAYTGEGLGSFQALMVSDSADEFVNRMTILQTIAGHQDAILKDAAAANVAAAQAQATAQSAAAEAQAQYDAVSAQQADLQAQVDEYRAAFDQLSAQERAAAQSAPVERASRAEREPIAETSGPIVADSEAAQIAIGAAMAQRGKPYVWAAGGPGAFDCSGLTSYAYRAAGISLPHSSRMQSQMGQAVARDDLQPGDLVFFYSPVSHVGIYIGDGQMVHAPTSGDVVKVAPLMSGFSGARRIAG
jgi:cell wall-associated NlpC family hydrolase